jgi:hypothetical protein
VYRVVSLYKLLSPRIGVIANASLHQRVLYRAQKYLGYRMEMGIFDGMPHLRLCILSTLAAVSLWRLSAAIKASNYARVFP